VIDEDGQMLGVMTPMQALAIARERDVDLVEVSPMAVPPVCKLMDWGRFKYEQAKKENEARKHQKIIELKEIRMKPRTDKADLDVKVRKIEEFLGEGDKVKVSVVFRGREMAHPELGRVVLEKVTGELKGIAAVERPPLMEGRMISMIVMRAPGWEPPKKEAPTPRVRKHDAQETDGEAEFDESPDAALDESALDAAPAAVTHAEVAGAASETPDATSAEGGPTA
jgi:translation initiation factor IF-3